MKGKFDRVEKAAEKAGKDFNETVGVIRNIAAVEKLSPEDLREVFEMGLELFRGKRKMRDKILNDFNKVNKLEKAGK